jgi:hypothetical protein
LNTTNLSNGSHRLTVRATYSDSSTAEQTVAVTIDNNLTSLASAQLASCTNVTMDASKGCTTSSQAALQPISMIGVFRPDTGEWFLDRNGNGEWDGCAIDACLSAFGKVGDSPVIGDWAGAGKSSIGTFSATTGSWQLDLNGNGQWDGCTVDMCVSSFGKSGDLPVTRGISGLNGSIIGTFTPQQSLWQFDLNSNGKFDNCSVDTCVQNFGNPEDIPVVGDWKGLGTGEVGVFRPSSGQWLLDGNGNGQLDSCGTDICIQQFGANGDLPIVGDWDGTGHVRVGVFRPGTGEWFLDMNGNGTFDGCAVDACLGPFGHAGDLPVVGKW